MYDNLVLTVFTCILIIYLFWGFFTLSDERWQFVASVPAYKEADGRWVGVNFTWYGLLTANAYIVALLVLLVLCGAVQIPPAVTFALITIMLGICVPASRIVARIVEGKYHTFTVGGAVFVGIVLAPWIITWLNMTLAKSLGYTIPVMTIYAAIAIAYCFGEGLGRLACISFGCCYGKPLYQLTGSTGKLFNDWGFTFIGKTKKAAYADNLEGVALFPIQALTSLIFTACGILSLILFMQSQHQYAFILAALVTQGWRAFSETLRADFRGKGRISAYQVLGIIGIGYAISMALLFNDQSTTQPILRVGINLLWSPLTLGFLQAIWLIIFIYTGRSTVTSSTISYHVTIDNV